MTNYAWRNFVPGCPQQVIAHADYRRQRGKRPSMTFRGINNPRLALESALAIITAQERACAEFVAFVKEKAAKLPKMWRDDNRDPRQPTVSTIVPCATDLVKVSSDNSYSLHIIHVKDFHGKGFMPQLRYADGQHHHGNGEVSVGDGPEAYDKALEKGEKWLNRVVAESDRVMQQSHRRRKRNPRH